MSMGIVAWLKDSVTGTFKETLKGTSGAAHTAEQNNIAAVQNPNSASNAWVRTKRKNNLAVISKTTAVTIGAGAANDTLLAGIHIFAALTGTCVITGFNDSDGTATSITIPAATAAGYRDFDDDVNAAGPLTVTCSNAADDNLVAVEWSPV